MTQPLLQAADLRGAARLTTEAVAGLASLVEALHAAITSRPRLPAAAGAGADRDDERTRGLTGLVYETVRGVTRVAGSSAEALLGWLAPALAAADPHQAPRPEREAILAALNGVLGDHLASSDNPLAIAMQFRHAGRVVPMDREAIRSRLRSAATPRLLVLLHGLCLNDLQWQRDGHDHGAALARDGGYTPVYLHYNTGLSISTNGRILAAVMERLFNAWPVPVERLVLLGHSMGGLVARSALHHGAWMQRNGLRWPGRVDDLVCLGSPHGGAPLERLGHGVDLLLGATPYAAPLARLGRLRSAGIQDLRAGHILKAPAPGAATGGADGDSADPPLAEPVPLPPGTRCYAIAGCLGADPSSRQARLLGDGLVPVPSALGLPDAPGGGLGFPPEHRVVLPATGHLELLSSAAVAAQLRQWLA